MPLSLAETDRTLCEGDTASPTIVMLEGAAPAVLVDFGPCDVVETSDPATLRRIAQRLISAANSLALLTAIAADGRTAAA